MDTDSFVISIKTADVIEDLYNLKDSFDFSNLNQENKWKVTKTKMWLVYS